MFQVSVRFMLLELTVKDVRSIPEDYCNQQDRDVSRTNKRKAIWFVFKSKDLEWWCGLINISPLKIKRGIKEILESQKQLPQK